MNKNKIAIIIIVLVIIIALIGAWFYLQYVMDNYGDDLEETMEATYEVHDQMGSLHLQNGKTL